MDYTPLFPFFEKGNPGKTIILKKNKKMPYI
jgi:hypothetical protein